MNARQKASSASQGMKKKKYVKNKLQIGDSRPNIMTKPDGRDSQMRLTSGSVGRANNLVDQTAKGTKKVRLQDGSKMKKEVRARSPRAASVYGSKKKAMKASYEKVTNKPVKPKAKPKVQSGGLTVKKPTAKPGSASNPIIGSPGRSLRSKKTFI